MSLFSLRRSRAPILISVFLFAIYFFVDLLVPLEDESRAADYIVLVLALGVFLYGWMLWIIYVMELLNSALDETTADEKLISRKIVILNLAAMYVLTLLQNTAIYAATSRIFRDAYVGIDASNISNIARILLSLFLSAETISALGTGAIYANPANGAGFLAVGLNSVQSLLFVGLIVSQVAAFISLGREERLFRRLIDDAEEREQRLVRSPERPREPLEF